MRSIMIAGLAALLLPLSLHAQITFERRYGGHSGDEYAYSVIQTADRGFIIAGYTVSFGAGASDVYLIRTNAVGETLWTETYGGGGYDKGYSVEQAEDDGFVIAGTVGVYAPTGDVYLIKTDADGRVGVGEGSTHDALPSTLDARPNPCRSSTVLRLTAGPLGCLPASVSGFDASGRLARSCAVSAWPFALSLDGLAPGTYFCRLSTATGQTAATTLVLLP